VLLHHHTRPDAAQDFILGNELAAGLDQYHQDIEGSAAKGNLHPLGKNLATVRQHLKAAEFYGHSDCCGSLQTCFSDFVNFFKMRPHRPGCQGKANSATRANAFSGR
jgi:hypothetical protein